MERHRKGRSRCTYKKTCTRRTHRPVHASTRRFLHRKRRSRRCIARCKEPPLPVSCKGVGHSTFFHIAPSTWRTSRCLGRIRRLRLQMCRSKMHSLRIVMWGSDLWYFAPMCSSAELWSLWMAYSGTVFALRCIAAGPGTVCPLWMCGGRPQIATLYTW